MKNFDIFLSYRSSDSTIAEELKGSLESRGVRVWLDKDQIRPGDLFAEALERGLATSRAVALLVTSNSLLSNWVKNEYYRALSLSAEGELQLIALLFDAVELPGFLKDRSWIDFKREDYDRCVDRLIWPGITGRKVLFVSVCPGDWSNWPELEEDLLEMGCKVREGEDIDRAPYGIARLISSSPIRVVAVVDIFEGWPKEGLKRNNPFQYCEFIFWMRDITKGTSEEIVFLLHHHSGGFEHYRYLDGEKTVRLAHYFTLHSDASRSQRKNELKTLWLRIQRELLNTEHVMRPNEVDSLVKVLKSGPAGSWR
jgi:hypothetical protein